MTTAQLNTEYAIAQPQSGAMYPSLQMSQYKSIGLADKLSLVLSPESLELMDLTKAASLDLMPKTCIYFDKNDDRLDIEMFEITADVRWVVLCKPKVLVVEKATGKIRPIAAGDNFVEMGLKTISKLFLCAVVEGNLILDKEDNPQIFTLKLQGLKTALIEDNKNKETKSIVSLNTGLCKHYGVKNAWLTHLVSVGLEVYTYTFKGDKGASVGGNFRLVGDAKVLSATEQKKAFQLANSEDFQAIADDPFGLARRASELPVSEPVNFVSEEILF